MFSALHYIAFAIATLPASGVLACILFQAWEEHRHWNSSNTTRAKDWHRKGRTASTQHRI